MATWGGSNYMIILFPYGGNAREAMEQAPERFRGFVDDDPATHGKPHVLGGRDHFTIHPCDEVLAGGQPAGEAAGVVGAEADLAILHAHLIVAILMRRWQSNQTARRMAC